MIESLEKQIIEETYPKLKFQKNILDLVKNKGYSLYSNSLPDNTIILYGVNKQNYTLSKDLETLNLLKKEYELEYIRLGVYLIRNYKKII